MQDKRGYNQLKNDIKYLLEKAKYRAYKAVDNIRVQTYWQIGERIAREELKEKRAGYGEFIITNLAKDLGFSKPRLHQMLRFYKEYPIVSTLWTQLSWSHYKILIYMEKEEREFYENYIVQNSVSVRELEKAIQQQIHKKQKKISSKTSQVPPLKNIFKEEYNFEFLNLKKNHKEADIENKLKILKKLIKAFGPNFFIGEIQQKILIDAQHHKIDLVLYNRLLKCFILVDFKIGSFKAEYVGQMNKHIRYYRKNIQGSWEKDTIGLILCHNKGVDEVYYALCGLEEDIFVAEYKAYLPKGKSFLIE